MLMQFPNMGQGDSVTDTYNQVAVGTESMPSQLFLYMTPVLLQEKKAGNAV